MSLPEYLLVAHNKEHAEELRNAFPGMSVIVNRGLNEEITRHRGKVSKR
jgi:hypothetical protein